MNNFNLKKALINTFGLSEAETELVLPFFKIKTYKKGDYFLKKGDHVKEVGYVLDGFLREFIIEEDDYEITKFLAKPGDFITDVEGINFFTPSRWNIYCLTDCIMSVIHRDDVESLKSKIPRWTEIEKLFNAKCFISAENRILDFLRFNAEERYQLMLKQNKEFFQIVPLNYIASYLGITPETLSRFRNKIK